MRNFPRNFLIAVVLLLPASLIGQGFTTQSVVDTRIQGGVGTLVDIAARVSGRSLHDVATTTYVQGPQLRTNDATSGMIIDLTAERMIEIDHKQKTYSSVTFAEMSAAMERARASAAQAKAKEEAKAAKADPATAAKKGELNVKYRVTVDRPGSSGSAIIAGCKTERIFITIILEGEATTEGQKTEQVGTMVFLMDQWIAKDAPHGRALTEFYRLYAQKLGREFRSQVQGLQALFATDARLKDGFEAAAKEMQKVSGIPLRSTLHVVLVPVNMTFDRALALNAAADLAAVAAKAAEAEKAKKPKSGFGGFLSSVVAAAEDASKAMDKGNQSNTTPPKQTTLLVMVDETQSISPGPVPEAMFAAPVGYREVKSKSY